MNLRDLEYLVAVADHRHFGRAAAACYVSQPTLSTQVKKLETELGVPLVERGSRSVLLTDVGERVVERARIVLGQVRDIRALARRAIDPRSGSLRLGMIPTLGAYLLPHVVDGLREHLPQLEVLLVEERTHVLLDRLRSGELDAAVLALPLADDGLVVEPLFDEDFVLALPADHPLAGSSQVALEQVEGHALLLEEGHCLRDQALELCRAAGVSERDGFRATSLETLRHMVGSGVGFTALPRLSVTEPVPPHRGVALVDLADRPHRRMALVWRAGSVFAGLLPEVADVIRRGVAPHVAVVASTAPEPGDAGPAAGGPGQVDAPAR